MEPEPIGRTNVNPSMVGGSEPNGGEVFLIMIRSFHIEGVSILRDGMDGGNGTARRVVSHPLEHAMKRHGNP